MATVKALLDANVLVPNSMRKTLETYARLGYYDAYWSPWIVEEMARAVTWRWVRARGIDKEAQDGLSRLAKLAMRHLEPTLHVVSPTLPYPVAWPTLRDSDDHPVWAAATRAGVGYVVSDNTRDFPPLDAGGLTRYAGITYITAKAFIVGIENGTI